MTPSEGNAPLPELHNTVVVAAFEGWNDAGDAASDAVAHLAASWQALPIVEIDDEAYYDYQVNRPVIRQVDGVTRELQWPAMRISHCRPPGSDRDVVLMCGVEPNMRWRTFCDELLAVIDKLNVDTVVILGALLADTPHTRPVPVSGAAYSAASARQFGLQETRYEGPTGIAGVFQSACVGAGIPAVTFWAAVPHYVSHPPNPKATIALLRRVEDTAHTAGTANAAGTASPAVTDQQPAGPASPARAAGTTHAARGSGIPVAAEATAATLGKAPSELVGEPTFPAVATEAAGSAGASDAAIATGAAGPAVTDQSRTVAGPTVLTGGTRPTVPAIAIQQSTRPTGLARPAVSAVADQRPANNAWVGALTALSTSCANVALAVSAAAYHPPPEVRAATNCARYAAACALICWYSCAFAPNSAAIAIDTSSAAVGRQRRRRACHERIGRADRRTDPRHICGGRGQKEGCAITNDM